SPDGNSFAPASRAPGQAFWTIPLAHLAGAGRKSANKDPRFCLEKTRFWTIWTISALQDGQLLRRHAPPSLFKSCHVIYNPDPPYSAETVQIVQMGQMPRFPKDFCIFPLADSSGSGAESAKKIVQSAEGAATRVWSVSRSSAQRYRYPRRRR